MWRNHLTDIEKELIIKEYRSGLTYGEIVDKHGFSTSSICRLVKGIRTRSESRNNSQIKGRWEMSDEGRKKLSENGKKACIRSGKFWTKPERHFRDLLLEVGVGVRFPDYVKEIKKIEDDDADKILCYQYPIQRYIIDFVDLENKTAINVNGDYWHGNPLLYAPDKLGKMQKINVRQDSNKRIFLEKNGWTVVDIWESEIYWNKEFVKEKIRAIILGGKPDVYTDQTEVQLSYRPPDWSDTIKRLWFKTDCPKRNKRMMLKKICANDLCKRDFETIDNGKKTNKYCNRLCSRIGSRKVLRPSAEELKKTIEKMPMTHVGKKYGVSDNAVRKWAIRYGINFK